MNDLEEIQAGWPARGEMDGEGSPLLHVINAIDEPKFPKNIPLLWKVYEHIRNHPAEWYQAHWCIRSAIRCETAMCFAGHTVMIAHPDAEPVFAENEFTTTYVHVDGRVDQFSQIAAVDLGLNQYEAAALFQGGNSLRDFRELIEYWDLEAASLEVAGD